MQSSRQKVNTAGLWSCRTDSTSCFVHTYIYVCRPTSPQECISWCAHTLQFISTPSCLFAKKIASKSWMAYSYYHQGGMPQTRLRKPAQHNSPVDLHEDKFISFSTSRHPLISSPTTPVTSTNRKPVIQLDSGEYSSGCRHSKWSEY